MLFRSVLAARQIQELYALRCLDMPALDVGGPDLLEAYEARIASEDPFLQTGDDMSFFIHGDGDFLKMDSEGRLQVSDFMRQHAHLTDKIAFVGRGRHFQIWEPERLNNYASQVRARLLKLRRSQLATAVSGAPQGEPE